MEPAGFLFRRLTFYEIIKIDKSVKSVLTLFSTARILFLHPGFKADSASFE